jgi:hypothetical protein
MARGWESKSVESQIESAETHVRRSPEKRIPANDIEQLRKKEGLILSRTRVLRELETSQNPRYRSLLEKALLDLNADLKRLERGSARAMSA